METNEYLTTKHGICLLKVKAQTMLLIEITTGLVEENHFYQYKYLNTHFWSLRNCSDRDPLS